MTDITLSLSKNKSISSSFEIFKAGTASTSSFIAFEIISRILIVDLV